MSYQDADVFSDVVDVLDDLRDNVTAYLSHNLEEEEEEERAERLTERDAGSTNVAREEKSEANEMSDTHKPSLSVAAISDSPVALYIHETIPALSRLTESVQEVLRDILSERRQTFTAASASRGAAVAAAPGAPRHEAVRALVTRKLADITENAMTMRRLVKGQSRLSSAPTPLSACTSATTVQESSARASAKMADELRMKQLLRVILHNLEDTERLLRIAYPETVTVASAPPTVAAQSPSASRNQDRRSQPSLAMSLLAQASRAGSGSPARASLSHNGSTTLHLRDSGQRPSTIAVSTASSTLSPSSTPRSSIDTVPYVRRSESMDTSPFTGLSPSQQGATVMMEGDLPSFTVRMEGDAGVHGGEPPLQPPQRTEDSPQLSQSSVLSNSADSVPQRTSDTSAATFPAPHVRFVVDELNSRETSADANSPPFTNEEEDSEGAAMVHEAVFPAQKDGLQSNPVLSHSSDGGSNTNSRLRTRRTSSPSAASLPISHRHHPFSSVPKSSMMQLAPFGRRRPSLTTDAPGFFSGSETPDLLSRSEATWAESTYANRTRGVPPTEGRDRDEREKASSSPSSASASLSMTGAHHAQWHDSPSHIINTTEVPRSILKTSLLRMGNSGSAGGAGGEDGTFFAPSCNRDSNPLRSPNTSRSGVVQFADEVTTYESRPLLDHVDGSAVGPDTSVTASDLGSLYSHVTSTNTRAVQLSSAQSHGGGRGRAPPFGLPPRSPRRQDPASHQNLPGEKFEQDVSGLPRPPLAPTPTDSPSVSFTSSTPPIRNVFVTTTHTQRLPGELWGQILATNRRKMTRVLRDDVVDLFNYGEEEPILQKDDVSDIEFRATEQYLSMRLCLEHPRALTESEIDLRLSLCSYPLMTGLYEDFFQEYHAKEFEPLEYDDVLTPLSTHSSPLLRKRGSSSSDTHSPTDTSGGTHTNNNGGARAASLPSHLLDDTSNFAARKREEVESPLHGASSKIAPETLAASDGGTYDLPPSPLSIERGEGVDSRTASIANEVPAPAPSQAAPFSREKNNLKDRKAEALRSAESHGHTVRVPGQHWAVVTQQTSEARLTEAFLDDVADAFGMLPEESRATCAHVRFYLGSLVVTFDWTNRKLYPGSLPLSSVEVDAILADYPFPSLKRIYADVRATLKVKDDTAAAPVEVAQTSMRDTTATPPSPATVVAEARLTLPDKAALDDTSAGKAPLPAQATAPRRRTDRPQRGGEDTRGRSPNTTPVVTLNPQPYPAAPPQATTAAVAPLHKTDSRSSETVGDAESREAMELPSVSIASLSSKYTRSSSPHRRTSSSQQSLPDNNASSSSGNSTAPPPAGTAATVLTTAKEPAHSPAASTVRRDSDGGSAINPRRAEPPSVSTPREPVTPQHLAQAPHVPSEDLRQRNRVLARTEDEDVQPVRAAAVKLHKPVGLPSSQGVPPPTCVSPDAAVTPSADTVPTAKTAEAIDETSVSKTLHDTVPSTDSVPAASPSLRSVSARRRADPISITALRRRPRLNRNPDGTAPTSARTPLPLMTQQPQQQQPLPPPSAAAAAAATAEEKQKYSKSDTAATPTPVTPLPAPEQQPTAPARGNLKAGAPPPTTAASSARTPSVRPAVDITAEPRRTASTRPAQTARPTVKATPPTPEPRSAAAPHAGSSASPALHNKSVTAMLAPKARTTLPLREEILSRAAPEPAEPEPVKPNTVPLARSNSADVRSRTSKTATAAGAPLVPATTGTAATAAVSAMTRKREASPRTPQTTTSTPASAASSLSPPPASSANANAATHRVYQLPLHALKVETTSTLHKNTVASEASATTKTTPAATSRSARRLTPRTVARDRTAGTGNTLSDSHNSNSAHHPPHVSKSANGSVESEGGLLRLPHAESILGLRLRGLVVESVEPGGVAAEAGVRMGDTLRTADGQMLLSKKDLHRAVTQHALRVRGDHPLFVTAVDVQGEPVPYRLCIPAILHGGDTATASVETAAAAAAPRRAPPKTRTVLLSSSAAPRQVLASPPRPPRHASPNPLRTDATATQASAGLPPTGAKTVEGAVLATRGRAAHPANVPSSLLMAPSSRVRVSSVGAQSREATESRRIHSSAVLRETAAPTSVLHSRVGSAANAAVLLSARRVGRDEAPLSARGEPAK